METCTIRSDMELKRTEREILYSEKVVQNSEENEV